MARGAGGGAPRGNLNAREPDVRERKAVARAARLLNLATPLAVRRLVQVLKNPKSTNMDLGYAAREILDRRFPKMTQAELALRGAPVVMLRVPGLNWPALASEMEGDGAAIPVAVAARGKSVTNGNGSSGA
jgi:hypothetical protein